LCTRIFIVSRSSFTPASTRSVAERNAAFCETLERFLHFDSQFTWMIDMHTHPERMIFREHRDNSGVIRAVEKLEPACQCEKFDVLIARSLDSSL